jgi:FdhE protein
VPYLRVAARSQAELLALATGRWRALVDAHPDLQSAVDLQRGLLSHVIDLARTIDGRLPRLSLPPKYIAAKLARGVPAFAGEPIPLPGPLLTASLLHFCRLLEAGGAGDAAANLATAIETGRLDGPSLLAACFGREHEAVRAAVTRLDLAPDLAWLVAELAVQPVAFALQRALFASETGPLADGLATWTQGYCPACGTWPALAEVVDRHRLLRCAFCAAAWERLRYSCVYCDEAGESFVTAAPTPERDDRRLELCRSCGAYLKTIDAPEATPFPLIAIADMETMDLDVAAMEHQYGRPPLGRWLRT